jgi:hypothetical protein
LISIPPKIETPFRINILLGSNVPGCMGLLSSLPAKMATDSERISQWGGTISLVPPNTCTISMVIGPLKSAWLRLYSAPPIIHTISPPLKFLDVTTFFTLPKIETLSITSSPGTGSASKPVVGGILLAPIPSQFLFPPYHFFLGLRMNINPNPISHQRPEIMFEIHIGNDIIRKKCTSHSYKDQP